MLSAAVVEDVPERLGFSSLLNILYDYNVLYVDIN